MLRMLLIALVLLSSCMPVKREDAGLHFKMALELNSSTKLWDASRLFKEELSSASEKWDIEEGEIIIDFFDQGMIGTERQLLEACYFGVVEIVQVNSSVVTTVQPAFAVLDLPYVFVNNEHLGEVLNGEIGADILGTLDEKGLSGLGFYSAGFRNMFYQTDGDCADSPEGLKGKKIRVMESPIMVNSINALGLSATPIPFSELYQSLKTGVVDGAENSADIFVSYKYYETGCNCFTLTEHFTNQHVIIANAEWLKGLAPKYRGRILEVARDIVPDFNLIWQDAVSVAIGEMKSHGVRINTVRDKREFLEKVGSIPENFFIQNPQVPREYYDRIRQAGEKYLTK